MQILVNIMLQPNYSGTLNYKSLDFIRESAALLTSTIVKRLGSVPRKPIVYIPEPYDKAL
jgi:hypothetical protein